MNKKKIILFDIDYTLFDTTKFKKIIAQEIAELTNSDNKNFPELLEEVYYQARFNNHFEPSVFPQALRKKITTTVENKELESVWFDSNNIKKALYPEAISVLQNLQKKGVLLGVFSTGNSEFQLAKVSLLADVLENAHIHIFTNKEEKIEYILNLYKEYSLYIVDDFLSILHKAKVKDQDVFTIWMKRGKFAEKAILPENFEPDAIIYSLEKVVPLIDITEQE